MSRTKLRIGDRKDIFLYYTRVENLFINEFLPDAPGDYVKVYLFCLMYAQYDEQIDSRAISMTLGISEDEIERAWEYWSKHGLVKLMVTGEGEREVEFVRQIDMLYGRGVSDGERSSAAYEGDGRSGGAAGADYADGYDVNADQNASAEEIIAKLINRQLKEIYDKYQMISGRTMSRQETTKLSDAVKVYNIEPDILNFAIDYCADLEKYSVDYIFKVALRWTEEGCRDVAQVKQMLDRHSKRSAAYGQIFRELGFSRLPNPADREIMDRWMDEMGYSIRDILDACRASGGIREPNLRYVNKVLENRMLEKGGIDTRALQRKEQGTRQAASQSAASHDQSGQPQPEAKVSRGVLREYFDYIRAREEEDRNSRIEEVKTKIPEMRQLMDMENRINQEMINLDPSMADRVKRSELRQKRRNLEDKKEELLTQHGYPADHLRRHYRCDKCRDTGYTDEGMVCTCCRERADEAYIWIQERGQNR